MSPLQAAGQAARDLVGAARRVLTRPARQARHTLKVWSTARAMVETDDNLRQEWTEVDRAYRDALAITGDNRRVPSCDELDAMVYGLADHDLRHEQRGTGSAT